MDRRGFLKTFLALPAAIIAGASLLKAKETTQLPLQLNPAQREILAGKSRFAEGVILDDFPKQKFVLFGQGKPRSKIVALVDNDQHPEPNPKSFRFRGVKCFYNESFPETKALPKESISISELPTEIRRALEQMVREDSLRLNSFPCGNYFFRGRPMRGWGRFLEDDNA